MPITKDIIMIIMLNNTVMKEKIVKATYLLGILGMSMFLISFFMDVETSEKMCLWVALIGVGSLFPVIKKRGGVGVKIIYGSILFWVMSRFMLVYGNDVASNIFSGAASIFLLCFIIKAMLYFNKYSSQDIDAHLDDEDY